MDWHTQPQADSYAFPVVAGGELLVKSLPPSPDSPQLEDYSCSKGSAHDREAEEKGSRSEPGPGLGSKGQSLALARGAPPGDAGAGLIPWEGMISKVLTQSAGRTEATPLAGRTAGPDGG